MRTQVGFTLIELMIVVAIIAILAAIAIPAYQDYTIRGQITECTRLIAGARAAVVDLLNDRGAFPVNNTEAGIAPPNSITGTYVSQVEINNGEVTCSFSSSAPQQANAAINGATMTWTPIDNSGSVSWTCSSSAPDRYLPTICR